MTMGALAVEHGFFSADAGDPSAPDYLDAGEALGIVDKFGEAWIFNVIAGVGGASALWAAERLPSSSVHVNANDLTVGALPPRVMERDDGGLADGGASGFLCSPGLVRAARAQGWYDPRRDGPALHFARTFSATSDTKREYVWRRQWRVYSTLAPSRGFSPDASAFPVAVRPDAAVRLTDVLALLRDFYEGTPYDLTRGVAAGPFGSPIRYDTWSESRSRFPNGGWERAISIDRGLFSFVAVSRPSLPDAVGAVVWYGWDWPSGSVYHPLWVSQREMPSGYDVYGAQSAFERGSPWRPFNLVNNFSLLRFDRMRRDIEAESRRWEARGFATAARAEAEALAAMAQSKEAQSGDAQTAGRVLGDASVAHADRVVAAWWALAWRLIAKWSNNYRLEGEGDDDWEELGYPDWWLGITDYATYPEVLSAPLRSKACGSGPARAGGRPAADARLGRGAPEDADEKDLFVVLRVQRSSWRIAVAAGTLFVVSAIVYWTWRLRAKDASRPAGGAGDEDGPSRPWRRAALLGEA
jgi:dipeptidase